MVIDTTALADLVVELQRAPTLESMMQLVVDRTAALLAVSRVNLRLLDRRQHRLLAKARAGRPLHATATTEFRVGEGLLGWIAEHGQPILAPDAEADPRFTPHPELRERVGAFLGVPLLAAEGCMGVLSAVNPERGAFGPQDQELLILLAALCAPQVELARLQRLAQLDPLTGVLNRRGLDLAMPLSPAPTDAARACVAMCDIDHFKAINDQHGHATGDEVLYIVALRLLNALRAGDSVIRYGGEEFLLVLHGVDGARAVAIAERARAAIADQPILLGGGTISTTISVGVAAQEVGEPRAGVIERADAALYRAKDAGRNRVARAP